MQLEDRIIESFIQSWDYYLHQGRRPCDSQQLCQSVSKGTKLAKVWGDFTENFRKWVIGQGTDLYISVMFQIPEGLWLSKVLSWFSLIIKQQTVLCNLVLILLLPYIDLVWGLHSECFSGSYCCQCQNNSRQIPGSLISLDGWLYLMFLIPGQEKVLEPLNEVKCSAARLNSASVCGSVSIICNYSTESLSSH